MCAGPAEQGAAPHLAIFADVGLLDPPETIEAFSSHRLLWETIREKINADPGAVGDDPAAYLDQQIRRCGVAGGTLDRVQFRHGLIRPAHGVAIARLLVHGGIPVRLHGAGWQSFVDLAPHAAGPVPHRPALHKALSACRAIVAAAFPPLPSLTAAARPILTTANKPPEQILHDAHRALRDTAPLPPPTPPLTPRSIVRLVSRLTATRSGARPPRPRRP